MLLNKTGKVALCGVVSALCVALMFLTGLVPIATYALPGLAGAMLIVVVAEVGQSWAWACWAVVSLLSLLVAGDKEAALVFLLFLGFYPILKARLDPVKPRWLSWALRFAAFNAAAIAYFFAATWILGLQKEEFTVFGLYLPWLLLLGGNAVFWLYDRALAGLVGFYFARLHTSILRVLKRK